MAPDGTVTHALDEFLTFVFALAVGPNDEVFVVEASGYTARRITPGIGSTTILDSSGDGAGNFLSYPNDIAVDAAGNAYVTGRFSQNAFKITPAGTVTEIIDATGDGVNSMNFHRVWTSMRRGTSTSRRTPVTSSRSRRAARRPVSSTPVATALETR